MSKRKQFRTVKKILKKYNDGKDEVPNVTTLHTHITKFKTVSDSKQKWSGIEIPGTDSIPN